MYIFCVLPVYWGWYLLPILLDWRSFICWSQKNFMCGLSSRFFPAIIYRISFSVDSLIPTPSCSILFSRFFSFSQRSMTSVLVATIVVLSFSGPHAAREAFGLAGSADDLVFLLLDLWMLLVAVEHGLHCSLVLSFDNDSSQSTERNITVTSKCEASLPGSFGIEWRRTKPDPEEHW